MAAEHGIDLAAADIRGSGRGGRITKQDILAYVEQKRLTTGDIPPWEQPGSGELFKPTEDVKEGLPAPRPAPSWDQDGTRAGASQGGLGPGREAGWAVQPALRQSRGKPAPTKVALATRPTASQQDYTSPAGLRQWYIFSFI
jgi:pyruvate/2-oxoglutarate dehydrogenase complex dihydrolipoamide acyltransferase (E2) component